MSQLNNNEIAFFKKALEKERLKILKNLNQTSGELNTYATQMPKDEADHASLALEQSFSHSIQKKQAAYLIEIEESLKQIKDKSYGICLLCEEPINIERLKVKIFAKYCIPCREEMEQNGLLDQ